MVPGTSTFTNTMSCISYKPEPKSRGGEFSLDAVSLEEGMTGLQSLMKSRIEAVVISSYSHHTGPSIVLFELHPMARLVLKVVRLVADTEPRVDSLPHTSHL